MAFSCVTRNVFSILPLLVILSISPLCTSYVPSGKVTKELLDSLCTNRTIEHNFCVAWLTYDPTTFTLDVSGLVDLVLMKTQSLAYKNLATMKGFARTTTDPTLKALYGSCVKVYELAIKAFEGAKWLARSESYDLASQAVSRAQSSLYNSCLDQFEGRDVPAYVRKRNYLYDSLCSIDIVFSNSVKT